MPTTTMRAFALAAALLLGPGLARAAEPTAFTCTFKSGWTYSYAKGVYKPERAKPLAIEVAEVDLEGQKAKLVTGKGEGRLTIVRALGANHYLEPVNEGFLNVTTIYDRDGARGHPAVHSRHFGLFGQPVVAQYHGFCKAK